MSRFQSGLVLTYPSNNTGRVFNRWLLEFAQLCGWEVVDTVGSGWNNYVATGSVCQSVSTKELEVTSPSYAFSSADEDSFLTLSGFGSPYDTRDGIYKIRRFVSSIGNAYTLKIEHRMGVHSDGLPVGHTDLTWKLWRGDATYTPTTDDIAVILGKGTTGGGRASGYGEGDALSVSGSTVTLIDSDANFQASDVGKEITITDASHGFNNGTFLITARLSPSQIQYTNPVGEDETCCFHWQVSYDYHAWFKVGASALYWPTLSVSPFASWNPATHTWNDNRYTAAKGFDFPIGTNCGECWIWAEGDKNHLTVFSLFVYSATLIRGEWAIWHIGELDAFHPEADPRPCIIYLGDETTNRKASYSIGTPLLGTGILTSEQSFYNGARGLASNDLTTLVYYLSFPHCPVNYNYNWLDQGKRAFSMHSKRVYLLPIILESRTTGNMEYRGTLRNISTLNGSFSPMTAISTNGNRLNALRNFSIPWNGSRTWQWQIGGSIIG